MRQELLVRFNDGHINVYDAQNLESEIISVYNHIIKPDQLKMLGFSTMEQVSTLSTRALIQRVFSPYKL